MFQWLWKILGTSRKTPLRAPEAQASIDAETEKLALYHFRSCPYCVRVRRAIDKLGLSIELRDIRQDGARREELIGGGGKKTVPCLRIEQGGEVRWMYESRDIVRYLEQRFS